MPTVVPADLPTADVVVVRDPGGHVVVFVDPRVPRPVVADTLADLDAVMGGRAYVLG